MVIRDADVSFLSNFRSKKLSKVVSSTFTTRSQEYTYPIQVRKGNCEINYDSLLERIRINDSAEITL